MEENTSLKGGEIIPFALKHIPKWNALEITQNGKNSGKVYSKFMSYLEETKHVPINNFTWMIPDTEIDNWMSRFGFITTMTQTLKSIKGMEEPIFPSISTQPKHMDSMKLQPFPFQQIGIAHLLSVEKGIIGDEMGLGKTSQSLGALHDLIQEGKIHKALVIPPASLKYQWAEEIEKFTEYKSIVIDGTAKKRQKQYAQFLQADIEICIAGYETVRADIESILTLPIDCVVCDEAQKLGNRKTKTYKTVSQLNPPYKFLLTGTPMQNKPDEIFALMNWIDPDILGGITQFRKNHVVVGEKFGRNYVDLGYKNLDDIREKISPYMIRRMKKEVAPDLPDILSVNSRVDMTKDQKLLYSAIEEDFSILQAELNDFYASQSDEDAKAQKKADGEQKILGFLYMMQAVSNHPHLLAKGSSKMAKKYLPLIRKCKTSPKLEELISLLSTALENGEKIVIFSRFVQMLDIIDQTIQRHFGFEPYRIHGSVPTKERQVRVNEFKEHPIRNIILLSDAGNAGLNLQEASTLINYDSVWNPAVMDQRNARIHRLNSTFDSVTVVNMLTNDTIDEAIEKRLVHKRALANGLIERNEAEKDIMQDLLESIG